MDFDPNFVYYTVMTRYEDQRLDLSMDRYSHTHTHTHTHTYIYFVGYLQMFFVCMLYIIM